MRSSNGERAAVGKETVTRTNDADCAPAYPAVWIPSPPPDLNCDDIPYLRFTVLPPAPHNFGGVGCESGSYVTQKGRGESVTLSCHSVKKRMASWNRRAGNCL